MLFSSALFADEISDFNKYAWSENSGWLNFKSTHEQVSVYNDHLEGYLWAENVGWIRLGTYSSGGNHTYTNASATTYGVNNDGSGNLSGYGWGENIGWINFNPTDNQVSIDPITGVFDGYAWAENIGWIHFQNATPAYQVVQKLDDTETIPVALDLSLNAQLAEFQSTAEVVGDSNQINLSQDAATGMLSARSGLSVFKFRPIKSETVDGMIVPGISLDEDGLINIVSEQGTQVLLLAEPQTIELLSSALNLFGFDSLQQDYGMIKIESTLDPDSANTWYAVRPAYASTQVSSHSIQALSNSPSSRPQNTVLFEHNFLIGSNQYQQILYPTPADWKRLKAYLKSFGQVAINDEGLITIVIAGVTYQAITDYKVEPSSQRIGQVELLAVGDLNADSKNDYHIIYPNGDIQILYLLPEN